MVKLLLPIIEIIFEIIILLPNYKYSRTVNYSNDMPLAQGIKFE